ncbi:MAG: M28 family peptidase [Phycisphaera sp.]|nr:M28 family peptidase [Phycisphaera sp.]
MITARNLVRLGLVVGSCALSGSLGSTTVHADGGGTSASTSESDLRSAVVDAPRVDRLSAWHDLLGSRPHVAGTEGDRVVIEAIAGVFDGMGLETETWWFDPFLARPVSASLTIVGEATPAPSGEPRGGRVRRGITSLAISERELLEDPATRHPDLAWGWNAYSGSGMVEANVVYANRGRREDFQRLRELGIDCTGKIVLVRYGGNYRGFKVKFAEEAGAAGLVVFLDPGDVGEDRGPTWPEGGWANETCIQRGSIVTLPYKGDPLTPFEPARGDVTRLDPADVALPTIPVQPIGYAAANRIMAAMSGPTVDAMGLADWTGGLDVPYRLEGGELELRLEVAQVREVMRTANVFGVLPGSERPDELVIVGCHHDAWGFGAADPLAGTIVLLETAKVFAEAAERGLRPRRTVIFAAWGAEEFGIIGSSEWVESQVERLGRDAVAYINLDMAAMGTSFRASATPSLAGAVMTAAGVVAQPGGEGSVLDAWRGEKKIPSVGDLGGGSDHIGFLCHVGVPSISLSAGGSPGTAYHSNYDTLAWYRSTVGEDYAGARMLTSITAALTADLADSLLPPIDPRPAVEGLARRLDDYEAAGRAAGLDIDLALLRAELASARSACEAASQRVEKAEDEEATIQALIDFDRAWLGDVGLPGRPWFRNEFAASDRDSGYGSVVLPCLSEAIRDRDQRAFDAAVVRYRTMLVRIREAADRISP